MSGRFAALRFRLQRVASLARRGAASVRSRGLTRTLQRLWLEFRPDRMPRQPLRIPSTGTPLPSMPSPAAAPRASIVIPVFNHWHHTELCLRALALCGDRSPFEVIVVDDGSSDATAANLAAIDGVRYHRNPRNLGFVGACNAGVALARGDYVVFLNNDTAVQPGWLDALLDTFAAHANVGLVGAKLIYPDGRLQEAGGLVFADGSGWNYGRYGHPHDPRYDFVRDTDYCSGAAIALPRALLAELGGFDDRYAPAYYEDTDLAMQVRARGLRVLYQPASAVVHFEGVTAGTDTAHGIKAQQPRNQRTFVARWGDTLRHDHPPAGGDPDRARDHRARHRVLVIDALTPQPDRDSGSLRLVNVLRMLREEGCAVTFFADNREHAGGYTRALQQLGVETWFRPWIGSIARWLRRHGHRFDVIMISRHYIAAGYLPLLRRHAPQAKFVFDTVDLHYLREARAAELGADPATLKSTQRKSAVATRNRELALIAAADLTLVVSAYERELLARDAPAARVEVLSNVHAIAGAGKPFAERRDLVFVGGFRHPPNVDAVLWLAADILPLLLHQLPDVHLHLIGDQVPPAVRALDRHPAITVHGHVPDLAPYMDGCRIALAPLRYGAGVKGKINLSMAHGQPVVATGCAIEGMHLDDGGDVLVADTPAEFAAAVARLYDDAALWQRLADHGLDNVRRHFSFDAARATVRRMLDH